MPSGDATTTSETETELERLALTIRHRAAVEALPTTPTLDRWKLLEQIFDPGDAIREASERRARGEMLKGGSSRTHVLLPRITDSSTVEST